MSHTDLQKAILSLKRPDHPSTYTIEVELDELEKFITQRETLAMMNTLTDIYVVIDEETAGNEYVFNLQNAIEDKIEALKATLPHPNTIKEVE